VEARHQRLGKVVALAVFSSDALSSVAYATEEILLALASAGAAALAFALPVALAIAGLIAVVATSYWQTIHAYPSGGGAYIVARENLGLVAGLIAAAALLTDYTLTVSVSVSAGVAAITSAVPGLYPHRVLAGVVLIGAVVLANLRGVRESGRIFAVPTYAFVATMGLLILSGLMTPAGEDRTAIPSPPPLQEAVSIFLILRAFASGATALTGIEAISNGVPVFRPPEARNAGITLIWMATLLGLLFLGVTALAVGFGVVPREGETVISLLARRIFGGGVLYYATQAATALILVLAANTSFADFPRLASILARDGFLPRQLAGRGDRLVFSNGILILGLLSALLLAAFRAQTHMLIPLYAVGVFLSFTLSQAGMVRRWWRQAGRGWVGHIAINGLGAIATTVVLSVVVMTKFVQGAWAVILLLPAFVAWLVAVRLHYRRVAVQLSIEGARRPTLGHVPIVVLVGRLNRGVLEALAFARAISTDVTAVTVDIDPTETSRLRMRWPEWFPDVPLVVLESPYRSIVSPLLEYIDRLDRDKPGPYLTVVLPEFVPARWWHHLLHNQTAFLIKAALLFRPGKITISVPYHLHE
jgi:amino acid transporter